MTEDHLTQTRRSALALTAAAGAFAALATTAEAAGDPAVDRRRHDWDWLVGRWNVQHRRLKGRLTGSTEWEEFHGTSVLWLTLDGLGTIDDNTLQLPDGTYRAVGIRAFDPKTSRWAIWWLDARNPTQIDPPVYGVFKDGAGTFTGDDTLNGRPIKVRYRWSDIASRSPRWEQAFSPDGGATWETNWTMQFSRAG
jgi:hypothetical protein